MKIAEKILKLFEEDKVKLDVYSMELIGPKKNLSKAKALAKKAIKDMEDAEAEYEDEGESQAMDARDSVFYDDYENKFKKLGFEVE